MNKQQLIILSGVPCSGKSTWALNYALDNRDYSVVNIDYLKNMLINYNHKSAYKILYKIVNSLLTEGRSVILDGCRDKFKDAEYFRSLYKETDLTIVNIDIEEDPEVILERNSKRPDKQEAYRTRSRPARIPHKELLKIVKY